MLSVFMFISICLCGAEDNKDIQGHPERPAFYHSCSHHGQQHFPEILVAAGRDNRGRHILVKENKREQVNTWLSQKSVVKYFNEGELLSLTNLKSIGWNPNSLYGNIDWLNFHNK